MQISNRTRFVLENIPITGRLHFYFNETSVVYRYSVLVTSHFTNVLNNYKDQSHLALGGMAANMLFPDGPAFSGPSWQTGDNCWVLACATSGPYMAGPGWGKGKSYGSGMVPLDRALLSSWDVYSNHFAICNSLATICNANFH